MKKLKLDLQGLNAEILTRSQLKQILGGDGSGGGGGSSSNMCNAYCGQGSGQSCDTVCPHCVDAGNGRGTGAGQDKLCAKFA